MNAQQGRQLSQQGNRKGKTDPKNRETLKAGRKGSRGREQSKTSLGSLVFLVRNAPIYRFIGGLILLFCTIFLVLSSLSYLFTSSEDQSFLRNYETFFAAVRDTEREPNAVSNIGGLLGAYVSDWLINSFLGLGSIILLLFPLIFSIRACSGKRTYKTSMARVFFVTAFSALWVAISSSYIDTIVKSTASFQIGGEQGKHLTQFLMTHLGHVGVLSLVLFSLIIIVATISQNSALWLQNMLSFSWLNFRVKKRLSSPEESLTEEQNYPEREETRSEKTDYSLEEEKETVVVLGGEPTPKKVEAEPKNEEDIVAEPIAQTFLVIEVPEGDETSLDASVEKRDDLGLPNYVFPSLDLLEIYERGDNTPDYEEIAGNERQIIDTLESFKIKARPTKATIGPTVTLYEIEPDAGVKISRIRNLDDDIALSLKSEGGIRIIAPIPGKGTIGIEVPNRRPQTVSFHSLLASKKFVENKMELPIAIGKTITNEVFMFDLAKMPHLLIAGATGQGKSVGLNVMISSLLYSKHPSELKFVMIDPKMLEFSVYEMLDRHYLAKLPEEDKCIITDMAKVVPTLNSLCVEMDNRYRLLTEARVRNITEYNKRIQNGDFATSDHHKFLPYIVLIIDEFADLIMTSGKEVERPITRIAQKARAAGIHMILATQRPTTDIITGTIKANFPARIAFKVFSSTDSRTILDGPGANHLVGRGDMLFYQGKDMLRLQCALIDTPETQRIVDAIAHQPSFTMPYNLPEAPVEEADEGRVVSLERRDALFEEVARMVVETQQGSTSKIQRHFEIGFNRAGRIMDQLEAAGIVAAQHGSKSREVLIPDLYALQNLLDSLK